jgi:uncharacterized lipoprotein YmbA
MPATILTEPERDLLGWYFPLPTALAAAMLLTGCGSTRAIDRQLAAAQVAAERATADAALAAERARVAEIHRGVR